ncbi:MAG: right-handed parallel beta-helix repeat-containing protein [Desulfuromonadales bacterium]|nr:right-handed parallel beta-helix repeat-containing protein [Desulfuromonadales bacterium]
MMLRRCLVLILLALSLPLPGLAGELQVYQGEQTLFADTVWSGDILIDGILTVAAGATLEIRPGTRVRFTRFDSNGDGIGEHEIFAQGRIRAVGTVEQPVLFTSAEENPRPGDWGAINMMVSEEENHLENCIVEYGYRGFHAHYSRARLLHDLFRNNMRGAQFQESQVVIEDCRFLDNLNGVQFRDSKVTLSGSTISGSQWGLRCVYSDLVMTACVIENNLVNGANIRDGKVEARGNRITGNRRGLYLQRCEGLVLGNDLSANSEHGIFLEESTVEVVANRLVENGRAGVRWLNSKGRLAQNLVAENGVYGLINDGANALDARNNWWGSSKPVDIAAAIRDGLDRPGLGLVDQRDALAQPLPFNLLLEKQ